jgi:hypothetical protein
MNAPPPYTRTLLDGSQERRIVAGFIMDTAFAQAVGPYLKLEYFASPYAKTAVKLTLDYVSKYHQAPGKDIQGLFAQHAKGNPDGMVLVAEYLSRLSKDYESGELEVNPKFLMDLAEKYFNERALKLLCQGIEAQLGRGNLAGAMELQAKYEPPVIAQGAITLEKALFTPTANLVMPFCDFVALPLPARRYCIRPWLKGDDIVLITGAPGVGKTYFSMEAARVASLSGWGMGGLWECELPIKTLYVDGELPQTDLQERGRLTGLAAGGNCTLLSKLRLEAADVPFNLANPKDRELLTRYILQGGYSLVILDNLYSLFVGIDLLSASDWSEINAWLLRLRAKGRTVVMVHHTTKAGDQFGTISKEFNATLSLLLKDAREPGEERATFTIRVTKQRELGLHLAGQKFQFSDGSWEVEDLAGGTRSDDYLLAQVALGLVAGQKQTQIAESVGKTPARICQLKARLEGEGYLTCQDGQFVLTDKGGELIDTWGLGIWKQVN